MYKSKPIMNVVQMERPATLIPEESSRKRVSEKVELFKMSSEKLEFSVKMWLYRKIKCKFKQKVGLIINM
jgi:hypothetical protein